MPAEYQPPRNAVTELFLAAPHELHDAMREELKKIDHVSYHDTHDTQLIWPRAPYHYGMGRIQRYEHWLSEQSEEDRQAEILACRIRYEAHYQHMAFLLVERMKELGHDLTPLVQERRAQKKEGTPKWEQPKTRDNYKPWEFLRNIDLAKSPYLSESAPQWAKKRYPYRLHGETALERRIKGTAHIQRKDNYQTELDYAVYQLGKMEAQAAKGVQFIPGALEKERQYVRDQAMLVRQNVRARMAKRDQPKP